MRSLAPQAAGRTYNLVGDESVTVREHRRHGARPRRRRRDRPHPGAHGGLRRRRGVRRARRAPSSAGTPATSFDEGVRRYVEWHVATRRDRRRRARRGSGACAAGRASRPVRLGRAVVADGVAVAGVLAAYLAAVHAVGVTADSDRTVAVLAVSTLAGVPGDGARRPAPCAVDLRAAGRSPPPAWSLVYMPEFREAVQLAGPTSRGSCSAWPAARWPWPSPTSACGCGRSGDERLAAGTAPRASRSRRPARATASRTGGSACAVRRQRARRAVVVGVVEQHDVARAQVARGARRRSPRGVARARQSRPQRDHSSGAPAAAAQRAPGRRR